MKESFYFSHDYNARNDQKILILRWDFWLEWYAMYFMMIESMAEESDWYINRQAIGGLSVSYGVARDRLLQFIEKCIEIGAFYEDNHGIFSKRMVEHKEYRKTLSEQGKAGAEKRWKNSPPNSPPNAKERKGKEIKVKDKEDSKKDIIEKDISILEKERDKHPIGSWRYKFYSFLLSHIEHIEHDINEQEIQKIDRKILEYRDKLWDDRAKLELESFCEYHRNENTIFKSTIGRLNTWLSNKLWK